MTGYVCPDCRKTVGPEHFGTGIVRSVVQCARGACHEVSEPEELPRCFPLSNSPQPVAERCGKDNNCTHELYPVVGTNEYRWGHETFVWQYVGFVCAGIHDFGHSYERKNA